MPQLTPQSPSLQVGAPRTRKFRCPFCVGTEVIPAASYPYTYSRIVMHLATCSAYPMPGDEIAQVAHAILDEIDGELA